ncbi:hypothetical protein ZWY2020_051524 [Hordeum vulgare]|nr:hypothetical protein ZWY2020_051524 [Hordeum vulgare]
MPGIVSFFLRLIREDGHRYRLIARRRHGVGGLRRFRRRMQAIRRFGRDATGRGYHGNRRGSRGGYRGPSRGPPGYVPIPMRAFADEAAALGFVSAPTDASGVIHLGVGMEGIDASAPPLQDMVAGSNGIAERRFGRLFGRIVASLDRRPCRHPGPWAPASFGFVVVPPQAGRRVPADVVVVS